MATTKSKLYREIIDQLVNVCREGQGQIGAQRVRKGVWNQNATAQFIADHPDMAELLADQCEINDLLSRLTAADREVLSKMLASEVETGVFEALKVLEQFQVSPFEDGYEGSPFHDFVGRLNGWEWPEGG